MATEYTTKQICDRCGYSEEFDSNGNEFSSMPMNTLPKTWTTVFVQSTNAHVEICITCQHDLYDYLKAKGAENMDKVVFREERVL